jgi:hypothetical protein
MNEPSTTLDIPPDTGGGRLPRSVLVVGGAIAALIVIALIVVLAVPDRPTEYPPGSPEAAFQGFYEAWESHDLDGAYARLSSDIRSDVTPADYRRMDSETSWARDQDQRVVLLDAVVTGDRATLELRIDQFSAGALGGERYSRSQTVPLVRENGAWYVDQGLLGVEVGHYQGST